MDNILNIKTGTLTILLADPVSEVAIDKVVELINSLLNNNISTLLYEFNSYEIWNKLKGQKDKNSNLYVAHKSYLEDMCKTTKNYKYLYDIKYLIIDGLMEISTKQPYCLGRGDIVSIIIQKLKKLAEQLNISIIATAPTNPKFYRFNNDKGKLLSYSCKAETAKDYVDNILLLENNIEIKELAYNGAYRIYEKTLPKQVQERLDKEQKSIIENDYTTLYMIAQKLVQKSNEDGYIMGIRGSVGSSLVAYCLGITEIDPIKYNIPFETFAGYYGNKEPNIVLTVAKDYKTKLEEYIVEILANSKEKLDNHTIEILEDDTITILNKLHELTSIDPTTISLYDKETLKTMCSADTLDIPYFNFKQVKDIILETKPTTFDELIKIAGLYYGTDLWTNNAQDLIKNGITTLNEIISCRDDIMNDLIKAGIDPKIAFEIMETMRKGKPVCNKEPLWEDYKNIMKKHNITEWYIKSCEKIRYAFPKAHLVSNTINAFRIAYYETHYSNEFYKVYEEI